MNFGVTSRGISYFFHLGIFAENFKSNESKAPGSEIYCYFARVLGVSYL